jgi:hypothetical protein
MAEITSGTPIAAPTSVPPAAASATPSVLQKIENTVFTFLQAHYAKLVAVVIGYAISHFAIIGKFL